MLQAILNKSWRQHPTKKQLYGHLPPIMKTINVGRIRHAAHCWRSVDELINKMLLWAPSHGRANVRRQARNYIQQLCADTGYSLEDLLGAMDDSDGWRERISEILASGAILYIYIYIYIIILYIYIYIYNVSNRHTVSLYYNSSVWLDT